MSKNPHINDRGYLIIEGGHELTLDARAGLRATKHRLSRGDILAINAALASGRPLLLRGEPGTGKSQLARAAAELLRRGFVHQSVDARTETRDLLWSLDNVARLATAQLLRAGEAQVDPKVELATERFVQPGALWWALDPVSAAAQRKDHVESLCAVDLHHIQTSLSAWKAGAQAPGGRPAPSERPASVVLIDELDKADPSVPSALLDALGQGGFNAPGLDRVCVPSEGPAPLIFITTNNERSLPPAFLRRCLVHRLSLPKDRPALIQHLIGLGALHFEGAHPQVLRRAAELLAEDRAALERRHQPAPGQAEYLDLLRILTSQSSEEGAQLRQLELVYGFALDKHREPLRAYTFGQEGAE